MIGKWAWGDQSPVRSIGAQAMLAAAIGLLLPAAANASITGVCPDGSIFIVQSKGSIPCRGAKAVEPSDVPPLKPEFLPRPYGWEVFNRRNDPNNPYNLIHSAPIDEPIVLRQQGSPAEEERVPARSEFVPENPAARPQSAPTQTASLQPRSFGLADREIHDLMTIVDLSQRHAPAALLSHGAGGRVQLALSHAFDARLREYFQQQGRTPAGTAVLFSVDTQQGGTFYGHLTFVQGHIAYQPDAADSLQLGLIDGAMGELAADAPVLGYVIVPDHIDLTQPIDIYWNDIQVTAKLTP